MTELKNLVTDLNHGTLTRCRVEIAARKLSAQSPVHRSIVFERISDTSGLIQLLLLMVIHNEEAPTVSDKVNQTVRVVPATGGTRLLIRISLFFKNSPM